MTDYLPPPPAEIVVEDIAPGQLEYERQGGADHKFWYHADNLYRSSNVRYFEVMYNQYNRQTKQIEEFEETLKEFLSDENIDSDTAESFASIFGISLKREYEFTVTVEFTFTAELGHDDDPDDVANNLEFSVTQSYYGDFEIDNDNYEVSDSQYVEV